MDKDKGLISQYTFSVSDDGRNWREVKKGQFSYHYIRKDPAVQRIDFGRPVEARYFKLDARSPVRGGFFFNNSSASKPFVAFSTT